MRRAASYAQLLARARRATQRADDALYTRTGGVVRNVFAVEAPHARAADAHAAAAAAAPTDAARERHLALERLHREAAASAKRGEEPEMERIRRSARSFDAPAENAPARTAERNAAIASAETQISRRIRGLGAIVRRRLQGATTATGVTPAVVQEVVPQLDRVLVSEVERTVEELTRATSRAASSAAREELKEALRRSGQTVDREAMAARRARELNAQAQDGFDLRGRLRRVSNDTADAIRRELTEARRASESALQASRRLERVAGRELQERLPRFVRELRDAARQAPASRDVRQAIARQEASVLRRSATSPEFSMKRANREFLRELKKANASEIDAVVERWVERKAQYRARMIARTEGQRAFHRSYLEETRHEDAVVGYRWELSPSHPRADICDVYAAYDGGFGPGTYRKDSPPEQPAHPNCLCALTAIVVDADGRPPPSTGGDASLGDALARLPEDTQRTVLGPRRFDAMRSQAVSPKGLFREQEGWGTSRIATIDELRPKRRRSRSA